MKYDQKYRLAVDNLAEVFKDNFETRGIDSPYTDFRKLGIRYQVDQYSIVSGFKNNDQWENLALHIHGDLITTLPIEMFAKFITMREHCDSETWLEYTREVISGDGRGIWIIKLINNDWGQLKTDSEIAITYCGDIPSSRDVLGLSGKWYDMTCSWERSYYRDHCISNRPSDRDNLTIADDGVMDNIRSELNKTLLRE